MCACQAGAERRVGVRGREARRRWWVAAPPTRRATTARARRRIAAAIARTAKPAANRLTASRRGISRRGRDGMVRPEPRRKDLAGGRTLDRGDEAVAAPSERPDMNRGDSALSPSTARSSRNRVVHALFEIDEGIASPQRLLDILPRHHCSGTRQEQTQQLQRLRSNADRATALRVARACRRRARTRRSDSGRCATKAPGVRSWNNPRGLRDGVGSRMIARAAGRSGDYPSLQLLAPHHVARSSQMQPFCTARSWHPATEVATLRRKGASMTTSSRPVSLQSTGRRAAIALLCAAAIAPIAAAGLGGRHARDTVWVTNRDQGTVAVHDASTLELLAGLDLRGHRACTTSPCPTGQARSSCLTMRERSTCSRRRTWVSPPSTPFNSPRARGRTTSPSAMTERRSSSACSAATRSPQSMPAPTRCPRCRRADQPGSTAHAPRAVA